jgi:predicted nucleic acid-binding protein
MSNYFLDSSALVKYYHTETGSAEVNRLIHELNAHHYISRLITVEVTSAFAVKTRTGELDERDFAPLLRRLRTLDALHLAVALDLRRRGILDHFVCGDESLCSIAIEEGLSTLNPAQL